ncbi:conserved hypothetical protein [Burkholderia cenocepacia PC184]|nr:conserved hypothetical protein [Burkholderia cenocepacia PC184]
MNLKAEYFARYEALAAVSGRMLCAARGADWSALPGLQAEFMQLVDGLKEADPGVALDESDLGRKLDLIRRILADDAAIRDLASPDVARLSALFEALALDPGIDRPLPRARVGPCCGRRVRGARARRRTRRALFPRAAPACRAPDSQRCG